MRNLESLREPGMRCAEVYAAAARELVRAVRGKRSQVALSRRLGYRGNPVTDWEAGRSHPDTVEVLEAARLAKLPVKAAFERFHPAPAPRLELGARGLAQWLDAVRGSTTLAVLAERLGCSRYAVRRWFSAEAQVKLPAFLQLLDVPWLRLAWRCDQRNLGSVRVAEKAWLCREGVLRGQRAHVGEGRSDTVYYALTKPDWLDRARK